MGLHDDPEIKRLIRKFLHKPVCVKIDTSHPHSGEKGTVVAVDTIQNTPAIKVAGEYEEFYVFNEKELILI